jgi:hypothetical protein
MNNQAQDLHLAVIVVDWFVLPHAHGHKTDTEHWIMIKFCQCQLQKDFVFLCHNVFSLFPNEGNKELAKRLLTEHVDCIRDKVAHLADEKAHQNHYLGEIELALQMMFNKEKVNSQRIHWRKRPL